MELAAAIKLLGTLALAGAGLWLAQKLRQGARDAQLVRDLKEQVRVKDEQLEAANHAPRNRDEFVDRLRERGL